MADATTENVLPEEDFELAFEAAASDEIAEETTEEAEEETTEEETTEEETTEEETTEEETTEEETTEEETTEEAPEEKAPTAEDIAKAAADAVAAADKVKADAKAQADAATKAAADAKKVLDAAVAKEKPTEEEQADLDAADTNFPEVAKAVEIRERLLLAKVENVINAQLAALTSQIEQRIAPTEQIVGQTARNSHEKTILDSHADAFTLLPDVETWIKTQPQFLQTAYNNTLAKGSSTDVVELFDTYKTAAGLTKEGPTAEELAKEAATKAEKDRKKKDKEKKLDAQEGVRGRQTSQKAGIDENDFESAFEHTAGEQS
jgi:hypothetical protein